MGSFGRLFLIKKKPISLLELVSGFKGLCYALDWSLLKNLIMGVKSCSWFDILKYSSSLECKGNVPHLWAKLAQLQQWEVIHIWRELNQPTDWLSKSLFSSDVHFIDRFNCSNELFLLLLNDAAGKMYLRKEKKIVLSAQFIHSF